MSAKVTIDGAQSLGELSVTMSAAMISLTEQPLVASFPPEILTSIFKVMHDDALEAGLIRSASAVEGDRRRRDAEHSDSEDTDPSGDSDSSEDPDSHAGSDSSGDSEASDNSYRSEYGQGSANRDSDEHLTSPLSGVLPHGDLCEVIYEGECTPIFPNSVSKVCKYWDGVLALSPEFWTSFGVYLDEADHMEFFHTALNRGRGLRLNGLTITRSSTGASVTKEQEKDSLRQIFDYLLAQPDRLPQTSLIVHSSITEHLYVLRDAFVPGMRVLKLVARRRFCPPLSEPGIPRISLNLLNLSPSLRVLSLSGPLYVSLIRTIGWKNAAGRVSLESLTISLLRPEDGGKRSFDFHELWESFCRFASVKRWVLIDVSVKCNIDRWIDDLHNYGEYPSVPRVRFAIDTIVFENLPCTIMQPLLWYLPRVRSAVFRDCRFHGVSSLGARQVEVSGMSDPDALARFIETAGGARTVRFVGCAGFTDEFIQALYPITITNVWDDPPLINVTTLQIVNCSKFTIGALLNAMKHRIGYNDGRYGDVDPLITPLKTLTLCGVGSLPTAAQRAWFEDNLEVFEVHDNMP